MLAFGWNAESINPFVTQLILWLNRVAVWRVPQVQVHYSPQSYNNVSIAGALMLTLMPSLISERPYIGDEVGMLARKGGSYSRPIVGSIVDVRIEDFLDDDILFSAKHASNYIGKLPDIPEINQYNRYFISSSNFTTNVNLSAAEATKYLNTGEYLQLPDKWFEYAMVIDDYNGYIKAPKMNRPGEPTAEEIDERLDEYETNIGKIRVLSPQTLERWQSESYVKKLRLI